MSDKSVNEFEKAALEQRGIGVLSEFWYLLRQNNKWWLLPVLVGLILFGAIMMVSGTAAAPFIYALF